MRIIKFPELIQAHHYDCGATAIQSIFGYYGIDVRKDIIMNLAETTTEGTSVNRMKKMVKRYGLKYKAGKMAIGEVKKYIDRNIPVILLVQAWSGSRKADYERGWVDEHYVIAIGYDKNKIYFEDPWSILRTYLIYEDLKKRWHGIDKDGKKYINFGMAVYGKKRSCELDKAVYMG